MAYKMELSQDFDEGLYLELAIRDKNTGDYLSGDGIDHRLIILGWAEDYGRFGEFGQVVASNSNGMITAPELGVIAIAVPTAALLFGGAPVCQSPGAPVSPPYAPFFAVDRHRSLRFKILAVPADPSLVKLLAYGTISFGHR